MLTALSIRDVVLIERLDLAFGPGLTVLTGETGAGKSILLDSLGLALGARADAGLVRAGADQASVTACFAPPPAIRCRRCWTSRGWRPRTRSCCAAWSARDGRSRAFVNDQPVGVALLRRVGALLVEVQGQHEQMGLADPAEPRRACWMRSACRRRLRDAVRRGVARTGARRWRRWTRRARRSPRPSATRTGCATPSTNSPPWRRSEARRTGSPPSASACSRASAGPRRSPPRWPNSPRAIGAAPARPRRCVRRRGRCSGWSRRRSPTADNPAAPAMAALERAEEALAEAETLLTRLAAEARRRSAPAGTGGGAAVRAARRGPQARGGGRRPAGAAGYAGGAAGRAGNRRGRGRGAGTGGARRARARPTSRRRAALSAARQAAAMRLDRAVAKELPPLRLDKARFHARGRGAGGGRLGRRAAPIAVRFLIATNPGPGAGAAGADRLGRRAVAADAGAEGGAGRRLAGADAGVRRGGFRRRRRDRGGGGRAAGARWPSGCRCWW